MSKNEKSVKSTLLDRRSIRRYERETIQEEDLQFIFDAIRNTPTSYNGQQFSVPHRKRKRLSTVLSDRSR